MSGYHQTMHMGHAWLWSFIGDTVHEISRAHTLVNQVYLACGESSEVVTWCLSQWDGGDTENVSAN